MAAKKTREKKAPAPRWTPRRVDKPINTAKLPLPPPGYEEVNSWRHPEPQAPTWTPDPHDGLDPVVYRPAYYAAAPVNPVPPPRPRSPLVIVEPDPLDPQLPLPFLVAAERVYSFARNFPQEVNPETFVRMILARLCLKDPKVKVLLALDGDTGEVRGHVLATIESDGASTWAFCWQAQVDEKGTHILQQLMDIGIQWAKRQGATTILMATALDPDFWKRAYGFDTVRHVMKKPI